MMDGSRSGLTPVGEIRLGEDIAFLQRYGVRRDVLVWAQERAAVFGVTPATSLIANGLIEEADYYRCVADELGLDFELTADSHGQPFFSPPSPDDIRRMSRMVQVEEEGTYDLAKQFARKNLHLAPDCSRMSALKQWLFVNDNLKPRLKIVPFSANRQAIEERCSPGLFAEAIDGLRNRYPTLSARRVITPKQAVVLLLVLQLIIGMAFFSKPSIFLFLHMTATLFYLGCIALRILAALSFDRAAREPIPVAAFDYEQDHILPVYSVLVPLYGEHGQVSDLVASLAELDWPKERLEIKLVCEAEDTATIHTCREALTAKGLNHFAIIEVPRGDPQTKPKALAYAMPLCGGDLVVVYDAEDRPNPLQLREAYRKFRSGAPNLACLQAPLVIHNHGDSWFSRMFAIEYSALFDGLLPALARANAPVPLGGTSNHFRRNILDDIGGWDPYNVTEDADLGIRLARAGYRTGTLTLPTYEEAPIGFGVWVRQRTRWFKGWYQTWLVHMRHPVKTMRDLGTKNSVTFQLMIAGMAISALVHPLLLYFIAMDITGFASGGSWRTASGPLFILDIGTVLLGYLSFAWLAWLTLPVRRLSHLRWWLFGVPFYWLLISISAWRAVWQLLRKPHFWEKTPHGLSRQDATSPDEEAVSQPI